MYGARRPHGASHTTGGMCGRLAVRTIGGDRLPASRHVGFRMLVKEAHGVVIVGEPLDGAPVGAGIAERVPRGQQVRVLLVQFVFEPAEGAARGDLTNAQWAKLEAVLPPVRMGRPPRDPRTVIDAIRWRVRTGSPWRDMPERYGPWETAYGLFRQWQRDGTWQQRRTRATRRSTSIDPRRL